MSAPSNDNHLLDEDVSRTCVEFASPYRVLSKLRTQLNTERLQPPLFVMLIETYPMLSIFLARHIPLIATFIKKSFDECLSDSMFRSTTWTILQHEYIFRVLCMQIVYPLKMAEKEHIATQLYSRLDTEPVRQDRLMSLCEAIMCFCPGSLVEDAALAKYIPRFLRQLRYDRPHDAK
jgi:hypothetical protein